MGTSLSLTEDQIPEDPSTCRYKCLDLSQVVNLKEIKADLYSFFGGTFHKNKLWTG